MNCDNVVGRRISEAKEGTRKSLATDVTFELIKGDVTLTGGVEGWCKMPRDVLVDAGRQRSRSRGHYGVVNEIPIRSTVGDRCTTVVRQLHWTSVYWSLTVGGIRTGSHSLPRSALQT